MAVGVGGRNAQIALEFIVVYSFVLLVFLVFYALIISQRAATLNSQGYSTIQLLAQNVADYISQAAYSGSGYNVTVPLVGGVGVMPYNLSISTTGIVIASIKVGSQVTTAEAFSAGRNLVINGTQIGPSNSIGIYQIPILSGSLKLYNYRGTIYINEAPAPIGNLTGSVSLSPLWYVKAAKFAQFANSNSYVFVPFSPSLGIKPQDTGMTITLWAMSSYPTALYEEGLVTTNTCGYQLAWLLTNVIRISDQCGRSHKLEVIWQPEANQWYQITSTIGTANAVGDLVTLYIDGQRVGSGVVPSWTSGTAWSNVLLGSDNPGFSFNGLITDIQIYSRSIPASEVSALYYEGIGGVPVNSSGLEGWWRLNNNTVDYSGNGNSGMPVNVIYNSTLQATVQGYTINGGTAATDSLVGIASGTGIVGPSTASSNTLPLNLTASGGNWTVLTRPSPDLPTNITATAFNGNTAAQSMLAGWWPLNEGYGTYIHDESGKYDGGSAQNVVWVPVTNSTNFRPGHFPGSPGGASGSNTLDGFITMNAIPADNAIVANNTFTTVAWIYDSGQTGQEQGLLGGFGGSANGGFAVHAEGGGQMKSVIELSGGPSHVLDWPTGGVNGGFPLNTWEMVTAQYNGRTGEADVYLNNTVFASANIGSGLSFSGTGNFFIGDNVGQYPQGGKGFNGLITNVQIYSEQLTQSQISYLYGQGATGVPVGDAGLVGWWPLDGSARDLSPNNDSGAISYNVVFNNRVYFAHNGTSTAFGAAFDGSNSLIKIPNTPALEISGPVAVGAWVYLNQYSANYQVFDAPNEYCMLISGGFAQFGDCNAGSRVQAQTRVLPNRWYYIVGVFNGTNGEGITGADSAIFYDGVKQPAGYAGTWTESGSAVPSYIGQDDTFNKDFNGTITDVQVFNGILTTQEVQQLSEAGMPPTASLTVPGG